MGKHKSILLSHFCCTVGFPSSKSPLFCKTCVSLTTKLYERRFLEMYTSCCTSLSCFHAFIRHFDSAIRMEAKERGVMYDLG